MCLDGCEPSVGCWCSDSLAVTCAWSPPPPPVVTMATARVWFTVVTDCWLHQLVYNTTTLSFVIIAAVAVLLAVPSSLSVLPDYTVLFTVCH